MMRLLELVQALANCGTNVPHRQSPQQARHDLVAKFIRHDHQSFSAPSRRMGRHSLRQRKVPLPLASHERLGHLAGLILKQALCVERLSIKERLMGLALFVQLAECIVN
jgi:hypothetical protein